MRKPALNSLSDRALLAQIKRLRMREHLTTIEILLHLNEVERRRLHLKLGYSSLFDYCVRHLRYSSAGAGRRVAVARCIERHPEVLALLQDRKVNVTGISLVASVLHEGNKAEILQSIQRKTQREIEVIASRYRPPIVFRDRVKPVLVCVAKPPARRATPVTCEKTSPFFSFSEFEEPIWLFLQTSFCRSRH